MASRVRMKQNRGFASTATNKYATTGEYAPVYVVMGFVGVAILMGIHTAKQQLLHAPAVNVNKKRRESVPEVDIPHVVSSNSHRFINKSFLRKVSHIQSSSPSFTKSPQSQSFKTDPSTH